MNRRNFALSWGRKMFFGVSLPISLIVSLIYLRGFILPESAVEWIYFITSYIGIFGFLNVLVYFFLFCPVILLMPTYYVPRFWSLFLIVIFNLLLTLDALSFSSFHSHLYEFLSPELWNAGYEYLSVSKLFLGGTIAGILLIVIIFWIRGELTWKYMQGRFSNPVKNWYILFILICFFISKTIFSFQPIDSSLAKVFPLNVNFQREVQKTKDNRKFYYPSRELTCKGKNNPNIILVVIKEWGESQLSEELMPKVFHMKEHAINFRSHLNVATTSQDGIFSLLYSIPASYRDLSYKAWPVIFQELQRRNYEIVDFMDESSFPRFDEWLKKRSGDEERPFFLSFTLGQHPFELDSQIDKMILRLENESLLRNTEIILTGGTSGSVTEKLPLMWFRPLRKFSEIKHATSPYDVMPTLMQEIWSCKNPFEVASVGVPLFEAKREWVVATDNQGFKILDLKNDNIINYSSGQVTVAGDDPRYDLIFSGMKIMTKFNRP